MFKVLCLKILSRFYPFVRILVLSFTIIGLSGCTSIGVVENKAITSPSENDKYSIRNVYGNRPNSDMGIVLSFSGGGTRAAALSYGVLLELRDTVAIYQGIPRSFLEDVNIISAVSGGSFTAAYYGLYGDAIFENFESDFLEPDFEANLINSLFNPFQWLSTSSRTELAVERFQDKIFKNATFSDLRRKDAPMIMINTSDLSTGSRFSFTQEYFNLICSDLGSFPVARAVAASAAVPVLFAPVVLENRNDCDVDAEIDAIQKAKATTHSLEMRLAASNLEKIVAKKNEYRYLHLVDGGLTDNLGIRTLYEVIQLYGGAKPFVDANGFREITKSVVIIVDAATSPNYEFTQSTSEPSIESTVNAMSDIQLRRYNASSLELFYESMVEWLDELYTSETSIDSYVIVVSLTDGLKEEEANLINAIPTSLYLTQEQIELLVNAGRKLLRNHPQFKKLLSSYGTKIYKKASAK